jgi:hypothetical protein
MKKLLQVKAWVLGILAGILLLLGIIGGLFNVKIIFTQWTYLYVGMAFTQFAILVLLLSHSIKEKTEK